MFDADQYLESLKPPEIKLQGKVYKGRLLSLEEWLPFEQTLGAFKTVKENGNAVQDLAAMKSVIRKFCEVVFPTPFWQIFNPFKKTVAEMVIALPPAVMFKATRDFFESQARGLDALRAEAQEIQGTETEEE